MLEKIMLFIFRHGVGLALTAYAIIALGIICYFEANPVLPQF